MGSVRPTVLLAFAALCGLYAFSQQTLVDQDLWGHLAFGRALFSGGLVAVDPYSYLPTHPWVNHEWLCEALLYQLLLLGGSPALLAFKAAAGALVGLCLCATALLGTTHGDAAAARGNIPPTSALPLLVCLLVGLHGVEYDIHVRPYVISYLMFAAFMCLLELGRQRPRAAWLLVPLSLLWANCHASFVMGLGMIFLYAISTAIRGERSLFPVLAAATLVTVINPYGAAYWRFVVGAVAMSRPYITEFQPLPWWPAQHGLLLFWECKLLMLTAIILLITDRHRLTNAAPWAIMAITAAMALQHYRHVPLFILAATSYMPSLWGDAHGVSKTMNWTHNARHPHLSKGDTLIMSIVAVFIVARLLTQPWHLRIPIDPAEGGYAFPLSALSFIERNHLQGKCLNYFDWGEMLIWDDRDLKVAFDGRLETVYDKNIIDANLAFTRGKDDTLLRQYPPDLVLILSSSGATRLMQQQPAWVMIYQDPLASIFVPRASAPSHLLAPVVCEGYDIPFDRWIATHACGPQP
jgi:hypothetical protein